ncbi:MAG: hypothetical protein RR931_01870 [Mucinivorans sp.]
MRKRLFISVLFCAFTSMVMAQSTEACYSKELSGGKYVIEHLNIPMKMFRLAEITDLLDGSVWQCSFEVDKNGRTDKVTVPRGINEIFNDMFISTVLLMPRWQTPATKGGVATSSFQTLSFQTYYKWVDAEFERKLWADNRDKKVRQIEASDPIFKQRYPEMAAQFSVENSRTLFVLIGKRYYQFTITLLP